MAISMLLNTVASAAALASIALAIDIVEKDVVIVGGGASGAYAAFRFREDYGKSIALIEKESILVSTRALGSPRASRSAVAMSEFPCLTFLH